VRGNVASGISLPIYGCPKQSFRMIEDEPLFRLNKLQRSVRDAIK